MPGVSIEQLDGDVADEGKWCRYVEFEVHLDTRIARGIHKPGVRQGGPGW